jgi:hypothetical protein
MVVPKSILIITILLFAACHREPPLLPNGCYRTEEGTPLLRISGDEGQVVIPGDVRRVQLAQGRFWYGPHVTVKPGFYVQSPELRAVADQPLRWVRFRVRSTSNGPVILVPMEAAGEKEIKLGAACDAAK